MPVNLHFRGARARRVRPLRAGRERQGPVLYWMSRDQRAADNWALLYAQWLAIARQQPLAVVFCLVPRYPRAMRFQYGFMLAGLQELEAALQSHGIPLFVACGTPPATLPPLVESVGASVLVTDFDPLRHKRAWKDAVGRGLTIPMVEVDAHNIVPCWEASPKLEYAAYTLRPKLRRHEADFLETVPALRRHPFAWPTRLAAPAWLEVGATLRVADVAPPPRLPAAGERAAARALRAFVRERLAFYDEEASDPARDGQSHLSPYLHFGQLSAQRVAMDVRAAHVPERARQAFLEQLFVRRELSDNFCCYGAYDSPAGFPAWARQTLQQHAADPRPRIYRYPQFEAADTADPLWNAAQQELLKTGRMHGYLRMYWAKKILEWSATPEEALDTALRLNDRYQLDGRDPNGFTGVMWSIGGVHDRPWPERPVFGKIRSMTANGCRSKFDVDRYIARISALPA